MSKTKSDYLLGSTAYWTASVRAKESERTNGLFHDPWAMALAGEVGLSWMAGKTPESVIPIVLRTRFFDDFLQHVTNDLGIRQVVLLAAGLDTRAYRLNWPPGVRLIEVDQPDILAYKEAVLHEAGAQATFARTAVGADLTQPWTDNLLVHDFDPQVPTVWLLEGFLFYLPNDVIDHLLDTVTGLAVPGSWLAFDIVNSHVLTSPLTVKWVEMQAQAGAPWLGTMDDPVAYLAERGWTAVLTQAGAADAHYGRWPYPIIPVTMPNMPHNWYVTARFGLG
jgi:methyltransferase (TIGR00027 family)